MSYIQQFTNLPARQSFTLYDPLNPTNKWTAKLNPKEAPRKPGNVRKYTETTNGSAVILGDREYPPKEIALTWNVIDSAELTLMAAFTALSPIVLTDNRGNGYLGVLVIDDVGQISGMSKDVFAVKAMFLVIAPYNGNSTTLNQLAPPTLSFGLSSKAGYMTAGAVVYVWASVFSPTGESVLGPVATLTNTSGANAAFDVSFTPPTSNKYRKTRLYWNSSNNSSTATFLTDIQAGFPLDGQPTFTIFTNYVAYNYETTPLYGTAFTGTWRGGYWVQE